MLICLHMPGQEQSPTTSPTQSKNLLWGIWHSGSATWNWNKLTMTTSPSTPSYTRSSSDVKRSWDNGQPGNVDYLLTSHSGYCASLVNWIPVSSNLTVSSQVHMGAP